MIFRALRKGQKWILAVLVFLIVVTVSIREYDLLPDEWYFGQYLQDTVPHWDSTSSTPLPRKIWQIFSARADAQEQPRDSIDPKALGDTTSWIGLNPGYQYTLLGAGTTSSDDFVIKHFSHEKSIIDTYFSLRNPGLKTDLLRYLILWVEGGVYADLDTWAIKPIDAWVPEQLRSGGKVRAVVGLEWDQLDGEPWPGPGGEPSWATHVVQFCQWTLAAVPGHPLFENAVETALERISDLAAAKKTPISDLDPTGYVCTHLATIANFHHFTHREMYLTLSRKL